MKSAIKTPIRSSDELWQWAALKRSSDLASKYPELKPSARKPSLMAQGIMARFYTILRSTISGSLR